MRLHMKKLLIRMLIRIDSAIQSLDSISMNVRLGIVDLIWKLKEVKS